MPDNGSTLQQWLQQSKNPAAPKGAQAGAQQAAAYSSGDPGAQGSTLGQWLNQGGYAQNSTSWYTGANPDGTGNGWDTGFRQEAFKQYDETLKNFKENPQAFNDWLKRDDATGVVSWGKRDGAGTPDDPKFGDVYNAGKKVGNIFDDYKNPADANLMIADWMLDDKTKRKVFADPDRDRWLADEVEKSRASATDSLTKGVGAREFQADVDAEQKKLQEGSGNEWLIAGAAGAGGLLAGGAAFFTGGATAPLAVAGFSAAGAALAGGAAALNQDQLTELSARAIVQTRMADQEFGKFQAFTTGLSGWSQVGMKLISPVSNTVQGYADAKYGKIGDTHEDFYAIDSDGKRKAPAWLQVADVGATLADSVLQFSNPVGLGMYSATMGGSIVGEVGTLGTTGSSFDLRSGDFRDHEGFKENAAAWMNVGIDAVQLGMAHGLTNAARSARTLFGGEAAAAETAAPGILGRTKATLQEKLPAWAGGLKEGQTSVSLGGQRFVVDEASGRAVSRHFSLASLAPSELTQRTAVGLKTRINGARRAATETAARNEMRLVADDYFRTAKDLASGKTSRFGAALLNGFGEGAEEAVQGILEPISNDAPVNAREIAQQFFYGAAAGLGMGLATSIHAPSQSDKLYSRALNKGLLSGEMMSREQFAELPQDRQLALANMSEDEVAATKVARDAIAKALNVGTLETGVMGRYALSTGLASEFERTAARANSNITSVLKILPFNNGDVTDDFGGLGVNTAPTYAAEVSGWRAVEEIRKNVRALQTHVQTLTRDIAETKAALDSGQLDEAQAAQAGTRMAEMTEQLADATTAVDRGELFLDKMMASYEQLAQATDFNDVSAAIDAMNAELEGAYFGRTKFDGEPMSPDEARALRSAVSVLYSRDPNIEDGSFLQLVPRVSKALHFDQAHGVIQVHQSLIAAPNADHDGDNFRAARNLMLDRKAQNRLRSGEQYLAYTEEDGERRVTVKVAAPDSDPDMLALVAKAATHSDAAVRGAAAHHLDSLKKILWAQYSGHVADVAGFNRILDDLVRDIEKGAPAARNTFLDALATAEANAIQTVARDVGFAQWPWISQQITAKLDAIQQAYAANQPEFEYEPGETPQSATDSVPKAWVREVNLVEAATYGNTLQLVRSGTSGVRGAQSLHYTAYLALVEALAAKDTLSPDLMRSLVEFYEGRSGGVAQSSMDDMLNRNSTVRRVYADLQKILDESGIDYGKNSQAALMLLSMTRVQDFDFTDEGAVLQNRDITLLQFLLRRSVRIDRAAYAKVADRNEQIEQKLDMLERMTFPRNNDGGHSTAAQEAAFEVFADIPLYQLIGESSMYLGMQRSLRDLRTDFLDLDREARANRFSTLTRKAPYIGRSKRSNPPYAASEVEDGNLHPYRVAVDLLEAVVNKAAPQRADRSERVMAKFETGIAQLQKALETFPSLLSSADRAEFDALTTQHERVLFMVNSNESLARDIAQVFPQAVQLGAFRVDDLGNVYAAEWVTEMLGMKPAEALMHYWRNTVLTEYLMAGQFGDVEEMARQIKEQVDSDLDAAKAGHKTPRTYAKLQTGTARLLYRAAAQQDTIQLQQLLREMANAKDLRTFTRDVLNTPLYLGGHAPITPFVDDVAELDTSNERRWQPNFPGAQQREAIEKFADSAGRYSTALAHARAVQDSDTQIAGKIESFVLAQMGERVPVSDDARYLTAQLALAVENAQEIWTSVGPNTREVATAALQMGLPIRHNKGAADPAIAPFGEARVLAEGGGAKVSLMRAVADLTAYSEKDVLQNPSLLAHRSMRIQLENGAIIEWTAPEVTDVPVDAHNPSRPRPDLLQYARLLKDPATAGFVKEVLGLTVKERGLGTSMQTAFYADGDPAARHSLERLLDRSNFAHLFPGPEGSLNVAQAHEYISLVEGAVFKQVYGESAEMQTAGYYPLQQMISELVSAYTHALPGKLREEQARQMRNDVYVAVASAVQLLADQHSQSPLRLKAVVEMVKQDLRKRYGSATSSIMDGARTYDERAVLLLETARARLDAAHRQQERLVDDMRAAKTPADRDRIAERMRQVAADIEAYAENLETNLTDSSVDQVLAMFTISHDPATAAIQKRALLSYLGAGRLGYFTDEESEVWSLVRETLTSAEYKASGEENLPDEVWPTLSRAAATAFLSERARQTGTSVSMRMLEPSAGLWNDVSRYFDHTWSFLLDHATKTPVLEAAARLAHNAGYTSHLSVEEAAKQVERTVFSPKKLGAWSSTIVRQNIENRDALLSSAVGMAVAIPGDLPTVMTTTTTALERSYDVPTEPPSVRELTPDDLLDPKVAARLNNRFVLRNGGAVLNYTDAETGQPATYDLFEDSQLGMPWGDPDDTEQAQVFNSGYVLISYERLMAALERGLVNATGGQPSSGWSVSLTMFDPEHRPAGAQWAHNVFYSGIAREAERGTRDSAIAETFFSSDGIYQTLVQAPLDALKKAKAAFTPTPHIDLDVAKSTETSDQSIYRQLEDKALLLLEREYDFGKLQSGDLNMLMELLRARHMVRVTNESGQTELWSVDRAVDHQRTEERQLQMELVPLSEELSNKLLGETTGRGSSLAPSIDQRDISKFTEFDEDLLRARGIDALGQVGDIRQSKFRHRVPLATVSGSHPDAAAGIGRYEARTHRLRTNLAQKLAQRSQLVGTGTGRFDVDRMAATAQAFLKDALSSEAVAAKMAHAGLAQFGPPTEAQDAMTQRVMSDIMRRTEGTSGSTYFLHRWNVSPDPSAGVLTEESFSQGDSPFMPGLDDHVFLDLASLETLGLPDAKTLDRAKAVAAQYADRGATIHLINGSGARKLREDLRRYLLSDTIGYTSLSSHTLVPVLSDTEYSQTARAMERTLIETREVSRDRLRWEFRSSQFVQANENASHWNATDDPATWPIMRANILAKRPAGFGRPQTSEQRELARTRLLEIFDLPGGMDHLVKLAGEGEGIAEALTKLKSQLASGNFPTSVGQEFGFGYFDVLVGPNDTIYLSRQGMESLTAREVEKQARIPLGATAENPGVPGAGVAVGPSVRDETLTTNVGEVVRLEPSQFGGGEQVVLRINVGTTGAKVLGDLDGMKHGIIPMPSDLAFPAAPLSPGQPISIGSGRVAGRSKEALFGTLNNFRNAFLAKGADFRADMIEFVTGEKPTRENFDAEWARVEVVLRSIAKADFNVDASDVAAAIRNDSFLASYGQLLSERLGDELGLDESLSGWLQTPDTTDNPTQRLGLLLTASLMVPEVQLEHVIATQGVDDIRLLASSDRALLMPQVFTDALDDYRYPALREMLFDRINAKFPPADADGTRAYTLMPDWTFVVRMLRNGKPEFFRGELKLTDVQLDDAHPDLQVQSEKSSTSAGVSLHGAAQASVLFSGSIAHAKDFTDRAVPDAFGDGERLFELLTDIAGDDLPELDKTPSERLWTAAGRRRHALYLQPVDTAEFTDAGREKYTRLARRFAQETFGDESWAHEADYLVRLALGARGIDTTSEGEHEGVDRVPEDQALEALSIIMENVGQGFFPLHGTTVPLVDYQFLSNLFEANKSRTNAWSPLVQTGRGHVAAKMDLVSWIDAAFGQMLESEASFDAAFRLDLDGVFQTYDDALPELRNLPPSTSPLIAMKLYDPKVQELAASVDPNTRVVLGEIVAPSGQRMTMESFLLGEAEYSRDVASHTTAAAMSRRLARMQEWHAKNRTGPQKPGKVKDYIKDGAWYSRRAQGTHRFLNMLTNLRLGMAMFNPALMIAAIPESQIRNSLDNAVSLLTGTSVSAAGRKVAQLGEAIGVQTRYSTEELDRINDLIAVLGNDPRFMSMIYDELMYAHHIEPGESRTAATLEKFARLGSRMQDPTWGMFAKSVAKRYVETALAYIEFDPSENITVDAFISMMNNNPKWLHDVNPRGTDTSPLRGLNAHSAALNAVAQVRSTRANIVGKSLRGLYEPLTHNPNAGISLVGHLIKWPLVFSNYTAGAAMFVSGTGGVGDFVAAQLHGRNSAWFGKLQAIMRGQQYNEATDSTFDMSDVLEGLDLTRSFLRAGITWSGYMAYLLAGGVGLAGEDDEARRRRLLAQYYGAPLQYDPLALQNDFRNSDAIFLDSLPGPLHALAKVFARGDDEHPGESRSLMMPHWIIRQFVSPLVGMERFMHTGDLRQVKWGFMDAISVLPLSVTRTFSDAIAAADELTKMAENESRVGTPESMVNTNRLIISTVGIYERMFLESSFVNTIRNGSDKYDRNPWAIPKTDAAGNIVRDNMGNPEYTDALVTFRNEQGEIQQGYNSRDFWDAQLHQYAENNATFSMLASVFTGKFGQSDYLRKNMPVKQVEVPLKSRSDDDAKKLIAQMMSSQGGAPALTESEAVNLLRNQIHTATGQWKSTAELAPYAMSVVKGAQEQLTKQGARTIIESIYAGSVDMGAPSLTGVYITKEQRREIQKDLIEDLVNEGLEWGMDDVSAKSRANRIWWGHNTDNPDQIGLRDLVWSNDIAHKPTAAYNQLNTSYLIGPGGRPYAIGAGRDSWLEALGVNFIGKGFTVNKDNGLGGDGRLNATDNVLGINTGLRALERNEGESLTPEDDEAKKVFGQKFQKPSSNGYSRYGGYRSYRRGSGYRRRSYGGYSGGGGGFANFQKMYALPDSKAPYGDSIPFINTSNPIIRRADVRRERVWSERGRLKQWQ